MIKYRLATKNEYNEVLVTDLLAESYDEARFVGYIMCEDEFIIEKIEEFIYPN